MSTATADRWDQLDRRVQRLANALLFRDWRGCSATRRLHVAPQVALPLRLTRSAPFAGSPTDYTAAVRLGRYIDGLDGHDRPLWLQLPQSWRGDGLGALTPARLQWGFRMPVRHICEVRRLRLLRPFARNRTD